MSAEAQEYPSSQQCISKGLPEVPNAVTPELKRFGQYQEHYNLWSVHEVGNPSDIVTFLRPEARKMTEAELAKLESFAPGLDAVEKSVKVFKKMETSMALVTKSKDVVLSQGLDHNDAVRPRVGTVDSRERINDELVFSKDTVERRKLTSTSTSTVNLKSQKPNDNLMGRADRALNKEMPEATKEIISEEALERINASFECKILMQKSEDNGIPEIFIESKIKGKCVSNHGRAIIRGLDTDRALIAAGQAPQSPTSWGHAFIYLPWERRLEVLTGLTVINKHVPSMMLLGGVVEIANIAGTPDQKNKYVHGAAARLDLVFRYGLLECNRKTKIADKIRELIPEEERSNAYSFAMQDSVRFGDIAMIKYCLQNGGRPISPYDGRNDYREDSPIEIAFEDGIKVIQDIVINSLSGAKDVSELKSLFLDDERWDPAPQEILEYISKF